MSHPDHAEPLQGIAIVGMAGRFPGARTLRQLWENLRNGVESISFFTDEELLASGVDPELLRHESYVRAKGILDDVEGFDAAFFGFTPREAELLDPQHRVLLECAWEALESAGYDPQGLGGRTAVYAGSGTSAYLISNLLPNREALEKTGVFQTLLSNDRDFLATRLSYKLDLRGPSVLVQTACSTSLTAVHLACQSLLSGEADMALAGGVSIGVPVKDGYLYQEGSIASPDGHCRSFDARAGGSVAGDGAGLVVLKRLADALEDGDRIHAVIRGSAINNDGSGKVGYTAPGIEGQAEVITEALLMAGVEPDSIGYVEAHGSGTALGDPVEMTALTQAFRAGTDRTGFCAVGSVKTNVGHCNTAAGVAGLIKAVLTLEHGEIPPSLHYEQPNPQIDFAGSPFFVNASLRPWPAEGAPRRAGVSSFGMGGTNVHVVLEEAPPPEPSEPSRCPAHLLPVSARTPAALDTAAANLADFLGREPGADLADVAFTLQTGRRGFDHRRVVVARDAQDAAAALVDPKRVISGVREGSAARPVVFLFPGLGDQYVDMARELYETEPAFREEIDRCAEILTPHLGFDIRRAIFSEGPAVSRPEGQGLDFRALLRRDASPDDPAAARLARTDVAQPACFAVEYALARLLMSWGIAPEAMIGYSIGEYVAACLAGVLSLEDALALVARRAKLIQELPAGAMLAVPLPEAEVRPLLGEGLSVSATNGPHLTVVGGPAEAVDALARALEGRGASTIRLQTTHAFHSAMTEPATAPFTAVARQVRMSPPRTPYLSNVTGTWITPGDLEDSTYWVRHMRRTVRFAEGLAELLKDPARLLLEVGPGATLGALARQHPDAPAGLVAASTLRRASEARSDVEHLLDAVGRLWAAGAEVDWKSLWTGERRRRVELPTYPFERRRCWIEPPRGGRPATAPRSQEAEARADLADWFYAPVWKQSPLVRRGRSLAGTSWLLVLDETGFGECLADRLRRDGAEVATVAPGEGFAGVAGHDRIVHLRSLTRGEPPFEAAVESGLASLVLLQQALTREEGEGDAPVRIAAVGNHLQEVLEGDPVEPAKAVLLGAVKILHQESPRLTCGAVDVVLPEAGSPAEERLLDQILDEVEAGLPPVVALRGRRRWVRSFERVRMDAVEPAASPVRPGGAFLVTDGAHGVGPSLAEHLVRTEGARVAVVLPPDAPAGPQPWEGLEGVHVLRADLAAPGGARSVLDQSRERLGRLDGVFVTGGSYTGGLLQLKTAEGLAAALGPLARSAEALLAALGDSSEPPAFVALCASTITFSGGLGQLDIAATGAFLDALALRQSAAGGVPVLALHWDPHQWGDWLAGAAGAGLVPGLATEQLQQEMDALRIPPAESAEALRRLLAGGLPRVIVSAGDLESLIAETDAFTLDVFLAEMEKARHSAQPHQRTGLSTPYIEPRNEMEERLAALWADLFGIDRIGVDDSFLELGGHSLLAIQLMTQVRNAFDVDLPVTALFEAPTIAGLAEAIAREQRGGEEDPAELEKLLALVEGLSPEEALAKMAELGIGIPEEATQ